jgi:NAD+ synthase (glutamine-hydrolysing)
MAWDINAGHIRAAIAAACESGVGVLCLPELCVTGYGCEDMYFSAGVQRTALDVLQELVPDTKGIFTCFGLPAFYEGALYNTAAVACDGK